MAEKEENKKPYDLEERTFQFAERVREYVKKLPKTLSNVEYSKQLILSSGSQASNYIEANESLGTKDFRMRIKICRKESKESRMWLKLSESVDSEKDKQKVLVQESLELTKIFGSILEKTK